MCIEWTEHRLQYYDDYFRQIMKGCSHKKVSKYSCIKNIYEVGLNMCLTEVCCRILEFNADIFSTLTKFLALFYSFQFLLQSTQYLHNTQKYILLKCTSYFNISSYVPANSLLLIWLIVAKSTRQMTLEAPLQYIPSPFTCKAFICGQSGHERGLCINHCPRKHHPV